jgi:hypothetical protein
MIAVPEGLPEYRFVAHLQLCAGVPIRSSTAGGVLDTFLDGVFFLPRVELANGVRSVRLRKPPSAPARAPVGRALGRAAVELP